jgi:hypothetical protein
VNDDTVEGIVNDYEKRIAELEEVSADAFVKFAKSYNAIDGRSKLFIHALKIAFDKTKGGAE